MIDYSIRSYTICLVYVYLVYYIIMVEDTIEYDGLLWYTISYH